MAPRTLPLIALTCGDPAGIGPEIVLAALASRELRARVRLVVLGPEALRPKRVPLLAERSGAALASIADAGWIATEAPRRWRMGAVQESCGRAALAALRAGAELARAGAVGALVTAPVSKAALHAAGERVEGQTELLGRWDGAREFQMLAIAGKLRVLLLTRHMPLRRALRAITPERVLAHLELLDRELRALGSAEPRIALAGLNPHAGEGGLLGDEELRLLAPAVRRARRRGIQVSDPQSPDTVFERASRGAFDAVLALYHDQAFIPVKLLAPRGGMTLILGLSYLRLSPAHGTAFDIAGRGLADPSNLIAALAQAGAWARSRGRAREALARRARASGR